MVTTRPPKTIVKPTALGPVANTDTKLLDLWAISKGPSFGTGRDGHRAGADIDPPDKTEQGDCRGTIIIIGTQPV